MSDEYFDKLQETIEGVKSKSSYTLDDVSEAIKQLDQPDGPLQAYSIDSRYNVFFSVAGRAKKLEDIDIETICSDYNLSHNFKSECVEFCLEKTNKRVAYIVYEPHTIAIDPSLENAPQLLQAIGDSFFELK